jgi:hypothetical protein
VRKNPLRDLHWVTECPEGSIRSCWRQKDSQEGIHILHLWEKEVEDKILKGSECSKKHRIDSTSVC